jgi:AcrR family transcriptional regulator
MRDQLFEATLQVVAERGFDPLSMRQVASEAGVTIGAIYAHFESKDDLLRGAMEYYRAIVPELDVPPARSVRELLCGRMKVLLASVDSGDERQITINRFQHELSRIERTEPAVRALGEEWHHARTDHLADRIEEVAEAGGERLVMEAKLLAAQTIAICSAFTELRRQNPALAPDHAALAAIEALAAAGVTPVAETTRRLTKEKP